MLLQIPLKDILLPPNRQRKVFESTALGELADSIRSQGLINPLSVRTTPEGRYVLAAGERRLRAIRDFIHLLGDTISFGGRFLPPGEVPCISLGALDPLEAEEVELAENLRRANLSWQEESAAVARVAALRAAQAAAAGAPAPRIADIAEEVHVAKRDGFEGGATPHGIATTRLQMLVAPHLADKEVAKAATLEEAAKILKRREELRRSRLMGEQLVNLPPSDRHRLINESCLPWLATAAAEQFDCIITDPPYGVSADAFGNAGGAGNVRAHEYEDSPEAFRELFSALPELLARVAKPQAHLYLFCDIDQFPWLREQFTFAGWNVHRTPLIFHKPQASRIPWPGIGPQRKWEMILFAERGKRAATGVFGDVLTYPADPQMNHPAQKPVALYRDLLSRCCRAGDSVLDPCAGSGPLLPAADSLNLYSTLIERDPTSFGMIVQRLEKLNKEKP